MTVAIHPLPLKSGSTGDRVNRIQKLLATLNLYSGKIDGDFGPITKEAVVKFQSR